MSLEMWWLFLLASLGLSLSPGPNGLLALTHGALHGQKKTLFTILGGASGFLILIACSFVGIAALLQASASWLLILKWLGGAYLVFLGIKVWRSPAIDLMADSDQQAHVVPSAHLFRQGAMAALSNPKVLLFFAAFLPQFIDPTRSLWLQFAVMAFTFVMIEIVVEYLIAGMAGRIRPWLARVGKQFNRCCGGLFVLIGAALPLRS